jgi:integrase
MLGAIYSSEKCPICGRRMIDNGFTAVSCPKHPDQIARKIRVRVRFKTDLTQRQFTLSNGLESYKEARRFLDGVRFKIDEGIFDHRDYKSDNPLGFYNLGQKWLEVKRSQIKPKSWNNLNNTLNRASKVWGNRNVKEIGYPEIEDFIFVSLEKLSSKSKANAASVLHSFWDWLRRRRILHLAEIPEFPEVPFELGFRNLVAKTDQAAIINKVHELCKDVNLRIWIGIKWLATYPSIRPGELITIKEGWINTETAYILIPHPKDKKPKAIPILDEDCELVKSLSRSFPELPFFRHFHGIGGSRPGEAFGPRYLYKWWKRACSALGIDHVDLYGGTKHSTAVELGDDFTPEQIKQAMMISTNKAFERYFRVKPKAIRAVYEKAKIEGDTQVTLLKGRRPSPSSRKP